MLYDMMAAMAADLQARVSGLPEGLHVQLGAQRLVETDKNLPLLNIWSNRAEMDRLDTSGTVEWNDRLVVGYYTASPGALELGIIDAADAEAHLNVFEDLCGRMVQWWPTVPGFATQTEFEFEHAVRGKTAGSALGSELWLTVKWWRS